MSENKRILILTADMGFGHRIAANAIASAIQEMIGEACTVDIINPLDEKRTPTLLRNQQSDYDWLVREYPDLMRVGYQINDLDTSIALIEAGLSVFLYPVLNHLIKQNTPDVIISTYNSYLAPLNRVLNSNKLNIPCLNVITDLTKLHRIWFNSNVDLTLVPTEEAYQEALSENLNPTNVFVTGIPVRPEIIKEKRSAMEIRAELGWHPDMTTALCVGSKRTKNLDKIFHILNHSGWSIQWIVVAGGDEELYSYLKNNHWHGRVHIYNYVEEMAQFLRASDFVLSKAGGLIVSESLACGLPMLLVDVTPGQELGNADYLINHGAGDLATSPEIALEALSHWMVDDQRLFKERSLIARQLGKPNAAYTIADLAIKAMVQQLPGLLTRPSKSKRVKKKSSNAGLPQFN
jgi:1,2-diacylglycerol 3-beta-galactosyltransferase